MGYPREGHGLSRQFLLDFPRRDPCTLDNLAIGEPNRFLFESVCKAHFLLSPGILLTGPPGSGKSHIVAIWCQRENALCLDAATLHVKGFPPELDQARFVAVEGVDDPDVDDCALLHLLNIVHEQGGRVLLTARNPNIASWPRTLNDLQSRLRALLPVRSGIPDDELLRGVLSKLFSDRQLPVNPEVIEYLINRMERSFTMANYVVDRLDRLSLEYGKAISKMLGKQVLSEWENARSQSVHV